MPSQHNTKSVAGFRVVAVFRCNSYSMDNKGWIKLHRVILDNPIFKKHKNLALFCYLLLKASFSDVNVIFGGKKITLKPGQFTTGRYVIQRDTGLNQSFIQRALKCFESEQLIEQRTDRQCRLITVINWERFQQSEQRNEQRMNNDRTTSEQRLNTKEEYKKVKNVKNYSSKEESVLQVADKNKKYGNEEINNILEQFLKISNVDDFRESKKQQRIWGKNLVVLKNRLGVEEFKRRIVEIFCDDFKAKNCNSLQYIYKEIKSFIN